MVNLSQVGDDIEGFVFDKLNSSNTSVQPYLIVVQSPVIIGKVVRTFLVLGQKTMQLAPCTTIKAFEWLLQAYFVFNVRVPLGWRATFHFLATMFYNAFEDRDIPDSFTSSEVELWNKINNVPVT